MATRQAGANNKRPPGPRLYLVAQASGEPRVLADAIVAAAGAGDVAAVLLALPDHDDASLIATVAAIAPAVQRHDVAVLLKARADLVARTGADGAHLDGVEAVRTSLPLLRPDRIAGAGGLASRHDAMLAGETGTDYVMFGEPDARGHRPRLDTIAERVAWWSEVFEPPCVAYAASLDEVAVLARAGADFIALDEMVWNGERGPVHALGQVGAELRSLELI
jgi:thiamine-phosphate pyrophosphorylase